MRDFNSYNGSNNNKGDAMKTLKDLANRYEGASETEIISAIFKEAEKGRANGTLSNEDIDRFASTIMPMLNQKQRLKLESVVKKLKETN